MTRPARLAIAILVAAALSSCGREGTPTGPSGPTSFLSGTWRGTVTIQVNPGDPESTGADEWRDDVDVRGRAPNEHAVFARHDPVDAFVADDGHDWNHGPLSRQQPPHPDQHAWGIQFAAWLSRHVRERRDRRGDTDRGRLHRHGLPARHVQWPDGAGEAIELWKRVADSHRHQPEGASHVASGPST